MGKLRDRGVVAINQPIHQGGNVRHARRAPWHSTTCARKLAGTAADIYKTICQSNPSKLRT